MWTVVSNDVLVLNETTERTIQKGQSLWDQAVDRLLAVLYSYGRMDMNYTHTHTYIRNTVLRCYSR